MAAIEDGEADMPKLIDRTGERRGKMVAIRPVKHELSSGRAMPAWYCLCDCGNAKTVLTVNWTKDKHRSCGCDKSRRISAHHRGDTKRPEYKVWTQMRQRCHSEYAPNYRFYGAKGVTVCDRWRFGEDGKTGFQCFMEDMGDRPEGMTLDRIDPLEGYGPDNCRWSSWAEQAKNKREHHSEAERRAACERRSMARRALTPCMVSQIEEMLGGGETQVRIGKAFGVSQATVSKVKLGQYWR